ncbi:DUF2062 domain-containing protein [Aurantimonas sp. A2-1-M11]|uniref:DUF2062 domain-containing protein n=1 Tax=Aurantimonas sp. A2-1-M11 TaxID=3113712 RepID=UPI002F945FD8
MLFRRRQPENFSARVRTILWPRRSFRRSFRYLRKRVLRLNATPHAIAAGVAAGVASSFTPFIGFHFLLAFALAYVTAGNMAAAALGTAAGNPLTFPIIWGATYETGQFLLHSRSHHVTEPEGLGTALGHMDFIAIWDPVVKPMLVGSLPLGLVAGLGCYGLVFFTARSFQRRRARKIIAGRTPRRRPRPGDDETGRSAGMV